MPAAAELAARGLGSAGTDAGTDTGASDPTMAEILARSLVSNTDRDSTTALWARSRLVNLGDEMGVVEVGVETEVEVGIGADLTGADMGTGTGTGTGTGVEVLEAALGVLGLPVLAALGTLGTLGALALDFLVAGSVAGLDLAALGLGSGTGLTTVGLDTLALDLRAAPGPLDFFSTFLFLSFPIIVSWFLNLSSGGGVESIPQSLSYLEPNHQMPDLRSFCGRSLGSIRNFSLGFTSTRQATDLPSESYQRRAA